jgi:uroporphyrinogen III methyltransferase / synthase
MNTKRFSKGLVYLIGAGPGDPGLITLKGRDCIARSDVILYDYLAHKGLLAFARPEAELIYAGKVGGSHNREQWQINDMLVEKALQGKVVARLKGGDPFIFGRGGEECEALVAAGIPFEIIPGITAAVGAAAYAGIPLTHRDFTTSVSLVTGHESNCKDASGIDWHSLASGTGTVVFYMGMKNLPQIVANLVNHGRPAQTPVALVRWGTRPEQEVLTGTLADIVELARRSGFKAPAVTIVGEVVRLRETLRWFDCRPLFGVGVLVTRATDQAGAFSRLLEGYGATVFECPTITIEPPENFAEVDDAIGQLAQFDWLIFTSANGVRVFFERLQTLGLDSRALGGRRIAAIGPKTAELLASHGIRPDLLPTGYHGEGLVAAFGRHAVAGMRALYPKADRAREVVVTGLTELGMAVTAPVAYRTTAPDAVPRELLAALEERRVHCATFTSASTVGNLAALLGENRLIHLLEDVAVAAIGPVTAAACRELGLRVDIEPDEATVEALTAALLDHFSSRQR